MLNIMLSRLKQGYRTADFPIEEKQLPAQFKGLPSLESKDCKNCGRCIKTCPVDCISTDKCLRIDIGQCIFCGKCAKVCPEGKIIFSKNYKMAFLKKEEMIIGNNIRSEIKAMGLFRRSFKLRQVSAGGCNACEADANVLNTLAWDLGRFGIQFVASPRHADGLLITGPVTKNMELALRKTYAAVPSPKVVIAVGACAISGGLFKEHEETLKGADSIVPVDCYVPGCPPHPATILYALLKVIGHKCVKQG